MEPIPDDCSPEMHADYEGYAVQWGLSNKKHSAAECCRACKEFKPKDGLDGCNIWVWCGESVSRKFSQIYVTDRQIW